MSEIEYHELIERIIPSNALQGFTLELEDVYRRENGWDVGDIVTENINENETKVTVPITKYKNNTDDELKTTYIATIDKSNYTNELTNLYEAYREEQGWVVGIPKITPINDNEIIVRIPLSKHEISLSK